MRSNDLFQERGVEKVTVDYLAACRRAAASTDHGAADAQAALEGITLHRIDGDFGRPVYIATRWAMTKQFDGLGEVEIWLDEVVGGAN